MSYTPGPWYFDSNQSTGAFEICADGHGATGGVLVLASRKEHPMKTSEMLSNARLIAAAPDLLEALQALVFAQDHRNLTHNSPHWSAARAAIAKATGEQK